MRQVHLELPEQDDGPRADDHTLEGEVARVTFENDDSGFRVLRVDVGAGQLETVVGVFPAAPAGTRVRATGRFADDPKHGRQFRATTLLPLAPSTLDGLRRYLGSGLVPGVGATMAARIVEAFGEATMDVLDRRPSRLREVPGIGPRRAEALAQSWQRHRDLGAIMVFLQAHGVSPALATRIYKRFGTEALHIVSHAPYRLSLEVWGIGFKTADAIARHIGVSADSPDRIQAGLLQVLHDVTAEGHCYAPEEALVESAAAMLEAPVAAVREALPALQRAGRIVREPSAPPPADLPHTAASGVDGRRDASPADLEAAVFLPAILGAEQRVAERLLRLGCAAPTLPGLDRALETFERQCGIRLADEQRDAVRHVAHNKLLILTGGPGVGKTTIVRAVLALCDAARLPVALCAPTGRAAKRMAEATGREAKTIHRMLGFEPKGGRFKHGTDHPIDAGMVVVDEASMVGIELADALLRAVADDARLVIVGDVDQLPSVSPGAVLRDAISSGRLPCARLDRIHRQAEGSSIVRNAHLINAGEMPEGGSGAAEQFFLIDRRSAESASELLRELVTRRIPKRFGLDPVRDVQVLTPMQKGPAGAIALNEVLQSVLNPHGPEVRRGSRTLRLGDKVMQLRNDYDREVFNGDVGTICAVDAAEHELTVRFDGREVAYSESDLDELGLAYATSIHKSQGNEYPAVVIPLLTQHFVMLSRNLLYTAVTRGKRLVVVVADPRALRMALSETRREERRTRLAERLRSWPTRSAGDG